MYIFILFQSFWVCLTAILMQLLSNDHDEDETMEIGKSLTHGRFYIIWSASKPDKGYPITVYLTVLLMASHLIFVYFEFIEILIFLSCTLS